MLQAKTILHPTDLSEPSDDAYRTACSLASGLKAQLIVLHIAPKGVVGYVGQMTELPSGEAKAKLWEALRRPREDEAGLDVTHEVEEGDPVGEILRVATGRHCDLIVMSTHGREGLARWFSGSVAEEIIRKAPCSVLVVKPAHSGGSVEESTQTTEPPPGPQQ